MIITEYLQEINSVLSEFSTRVKEITVQPKIESLDPLSEKQTGTIITFDIDHDVDFDAKDAVYGMLLAIIEAHPTGMSMMENLDEKIEEARFRLRAAHQRVKNLESWKEIRDKIEQLQTSSHVH